ncbi:AAA family ATPase [Thalassotalea sp. G20_0]|uniref:helicase RepA family protein n=1 Tax=Thalassotalea sp. G20_0 TaxID=2821093 RepID=UPI001ADD086C|nr:helicase RepA family protein [Thalassotalea sp. G20_0]MBO9494306.1 AAA family ATPase [Thalassotalea sp. G20_0]
MPDKNVNAEHGLEVAVIQIDKDNAISSLTSEDASSKEKGNDALKNILSSISEAIPETDLERREQMTPNLTNVERLQAESQNYQSDDHTDVDSEVPPEGVGSPFYGGSTRKFPTELLETGYDKEEDWVIKGYIPQNSFGVIYGPSESFKSFHAVSWAACIASGKPWNHVHCQQSPVLYIAAEGGFGAAKRAHGWKMTNNNGESLALLHSIKMPVFIGSPKTVNELINTIMDLNNQMEKKISVVFIDTLARCFGGADENKTADMNLFVSGCDKIKAETGATIIVIHHTGKNKERDARGSSALRAACDFEYCIDRPDKGMYYLLKCTKSKDSEPMPTQAFDMTPRFLRYDSDQDEVTTLVASLNGREPPEGCEADDKPLTLSKNQEALYQAVRSRTASGEPTTVAVIRDDLKAQGLAISNFSKWLEALVSKGLIRFDEDTLIPVNKG